MLCEERAARSGLARITRPGSKAKRAFNSKEPIHALEAAAVDAATKGDTKGYRAALRLAGTVESGGKQTQTEKVLLWLLSGKSLHQLAATDQGIMRLASRISDLGQLGYEIDRRTVLVDGKRVEAYWIREELIDLYRKELSRP